MKNIILLSMAILLAGCSARIHSPQESDPALLAAYNSLANQTFRVVGGSRTSERAESFTIKPSKNGTSWGALVFKSKDNDNPILIKEQQRITGCNVDKKRGGITCAVYDGHYRNPWIHIKRYTEDGAHASEALLKVRPDIDIQKGQVVLVLHTIGSEVFVGESQ